jgi:hypothetical protein
MLSVLFLLFHNALKKELVGQFFFVILAILIVEAQKGFLALSLLIYFFFIDKFIVPKINQNINSHTLKNILYVLLVYIGYIFFATLLSNVFLLPNITFDYYIVFYIVIELFIIGVLS